MMFVNIERHLPERSGLSHSIPDKSQRRDRLAEQKTNDDVLAFNSRASRGTKEQRKNNRDQKCGETELNPRARPFPTPQIRGDLANASLKISSERGFFGRHGMGFPFGRRDVRYRARVHFIAPSAF
jgi:hypothetical protein